jgi:hypothetical protein
MLLGAAAIAIVSASGAAYATHHWDQVKIEKMQLADAQAVIDAQKLAAQTQQLQDAASEKVAVEAAQAQQKIVTRTIETIRKVPVYVTREIDKRYPLSNAFCRLHDAAALETSPDAIPNPAGTTDAGPCQASESQTVSTIVSNYGTCAITSHQLTSLQDWIRAQQAVSASQKAP